MPPKNKRVKAFAKFFQNHMSVSTMNWIIFAACGLLIVSSAHADTDAFNSFGPGNTYDSGSVFFVGKSGPGSSPIEQAAQFTAQASGFLSTVELALNRPGNHTADPVSVFLYGDLNGSPDNSEQTFLGSVGPAGVFPQSNNAVATLDVSSQVTLSLGTTYWLVLKPAIPDGLTFWNFSTNTVGQMRNSIDDSTWYPSGDPRIAAFRINVMPVPEPNSTVLLSIGLAVSLLLIRRRIDRNTEM